MAMRACDGTDPFLVKKVDEKFVPCDCGKEFDDVGISVVYPHPRLQEAPKTKERREMWDSYLNGEFDL